jgi:hypothetical protein
MSADSTVLIQEAIQRLEALAEVLSTESDIQRCASRTLSSEERTRKEIGLSIRVLLPKLRSVGYEEPPHRRGCISCED